MNENVHHRKSAREFENVKKKNPFVFVENNAGLRDLKILSEEFTIANL